MDKAKVKVLQTEEKVIGHTEKVKCEVDSKPSIVELYKEGSLTR